MFKLPVFHQPKVWEAALVAASLVLGMGYLIIFQEWVPHLPILGAIFGLLLYGLSIKIPYHQLQNGMIESVHSCFAAVYLFFFIGLLVSALMMAGTIPTLIYYGFELISPDVFYISVFIICAIIGSTIGSSLTTCATIGVAFIGMSTALEGNLAITAGAIVSGAFFGDKMSPISDTTIIAASTVGIDVFEHIKNMAYTTIPALMLSVLGYWYLSPQPETLSKSEQVSIYQQAFLQTNLIHWYALIPFLLLIVLAILRVKAVVVMMLAILASLALTYCHSTPDLHTLGNYFFNGFTLPPGFNADVAKLVSRGGINSMFFSLTLVILALSLGGLLFALGIIPCLLTRMQKFLTNSARSTFSVAVTAVGVNFLIGEQYLSILLAAETFKGIYDKLNLHRKNLARTLEDAGTVINPLVPWSVCGVFISHTLGVPVWHYLSYAFFCYLCLVLTLIFGFTGLTLTKVASPAVK